MLVFTHAPFPAGDHKAARHIQVYEAICQRRTPIKEYHLETVSKKIGEKLVSIA